jgi:hypothetical protein
MDLRLREYYQISPSRKRKSILTKVKVGKEEDDHES